MSETKTVGIWIRVSTEDQARGESPETHERRARMYAEVKGWEVATVYHLEGVSGSVAMEHAEAKRMRSDVEAGRIDGLIFSKLARLARDTKGLLEVAEFFKEHEADLVSLGESIDTSSPAGRFFYTILAAMAAWEREETVERVKASIKTRAKAGKTLGGPAPLGYRWENKYLVPEESEVPVVKKLFETFVRERRIKTTAVVLNDAGYRTRRGAKFSSTTVKRLLTTPTMKGRHRLHYTTSRGNGQGWDLKPEEEWEYAEVEPIIPEDLWNEAQAILEEIAEKSKRKKRTGRKSAHLFTGLVYCTCQAGEKMYVPSNSPKYTCRACRRKIRITDLEEVFLARLRDFLLSRDEVKSYLSEANQRIDERKALLRTLVAEKREIEHEQSDLFTLYREGGLTTEGFKRKNEPLEERFKALVDEIPRVEGELAFLKVEASGSADIVSEGMLLVENWRTIPKEDRRVIVEHMVKEILVSETEVVIILRGAPKTLPSAPSSSPSGGNLGKNPHGFAVAISRKR